MVNEWEEGRPYPSSEDCKVQLAVVCCSKSQALLAVSHHLSVRVCHMGTVNAAEVCDMLPAECSKVRVITSELPGLGKTSIVYDIHSTGGVQTLSVSGNTSRSSLVSQLKELNLQPDCILHLDISSVVNPETFSGLLFELLVLGCLKSDIAGVFHLNIVSDVQIEIGNTLGNELARSLPICDWFQREHLTWDLELLKVKEDPSSDMQVVCIYLQALESSQLDVRDLNFSEESENETALPAIQCRDLLRRNFIDHVKEGNAMSFTVLEMFLKFLACQLRSMADSVFFKVETLQLMMAMANIRSCLVTSLVEVSRDLSLRSVKPWLHEQQESRGTEITDLTMETRFQGMLRWSDSNHLMTFFQSDGCVLFLYGNVDLLPRSITQLCASQCLGVEEQRTPNYTTMSSQELWKELWPILQPTAPAFQPTYVLTADNFLKMALIALRVAAQVPVLIMGETGCGKTSLLRILAKYCGVDFFSRTLHAGTTAEDIRCFIDESNKAAALAIQAGENKKVWAFLDEINACDHLGFLNGVICHHALDGKHLNRNLVVLAACNPYRRHDKENSQAGFSPRDLIVNPGDVQRYNLAYRVHPLPEAMLDYVWDFGLLSWQEEQAYIEAMAQEKVESQEVPLVANLLVQSQALIREAHGEASVSLRDASRCLSLYDFFLDDLPKRLLRSLGKFQNVGFRAKLLAFAHCYHSRLATEQQRQSYRDMFADVIRAYDRYRYFRGFTGDDFAKNLAAEQLDLLDRMEIPVGIAKNKALLENVFVTLVCMVNHIPVFVIGKPGSGKTLALQLIYGNMRGSESRDTYFRKLPQMYKFSYQGSESSTSEGILKVFEKAQRFRKDNEGRDVLVVVVLDEVGLAEVSKHNPLKVLHALLEPEEPQQVAVVGISNWSLDAAKMNRAIHLSQPDPSEEDLYNTSIAILKSLDTANSGYGFHQALEKELKGLAKAYHTYHACQTKPNFHGLRDFYALVKSLQVNWSLACSSLDGLGTAVWRNFGGSPDDVQTLSQILKLHMGNEELLIQPPPVMELVRENLEDKHARHLMLITNGDSAIGIVEKKFQKSVVIIHGSKFKDDCSDDYSYLLLSIIILHMEAGRCILLRGVERLWSSLYDMLNQHYTTVAERRNCRVAIGAYSNPMCYVHDSFRCIVVVDFSQVLHLDPPFLNRFEKQVLTYDTILKGYEKEAVTVLQSWCAQLAGLSANSEHSNNETVFQVHDLFAGFHEDTLPSLVLHHLPAHSDQASSCSTESLEFELLLDRCKEELLRTAHLDAMVRASLSAQCKDNVPDLDKWMSRFFGEWQNQQDLKEFIVTAILDESLEGLPRGLFGKRVVITTRTIIHMPIRKFLGEIETQIEKLGDFSSERQLQTQIQLFLGGNSNLLIVQADSVTDKEHIQHAKFLVDKSFADYHAPVSTGPPQAKNVILIIHSHREVETSSGFTFLSGWQQITLDQLQKEETDLRVFLDHSVADLVKTETIPLKDIMVKVFVWSFLCIKYPRSLNPAAYCQQMVQKIYEDKELWGCFKSRALTWLEENADPLWQASVASDRRLLSLSSSLQDAFLIYIEEKLRQPIARLVYLLEKSSDLGSYFKMDAVKKEVWRATMLNAEVVNIECVPAPRHPEGYHVKCPLNLSLPFIAAYSQLVDNGYQEKYLSQLSKKSSNEYTPSPSSNYEEISVDMIEEAINETMQDQLLELASCINKHPELYMGDFARLHAHYRSDSRSEVDSQAFEWILRTNLGVGVAVSPPRIHILFWDRGEKLKAQALLVASCLTDSCDAAWKLAQVKSRCLSAKEFHQYLVAQCYSAIVPQTGDFLRTGVEIGQWVEKLDLLINLALPFRAGSIPRWTTLLTALEVLRDLTYMVLPPLLLRKEALQELVKWLGSHGTDFSPGQLLETVLRLVPDLHTLTDSSLQAHWQRFLASFFKKVLEGQTYTMSDVNVIAAFVFELRDVTSVMKCLMVCLLHAILPRTLDFQMDAQCPKYMQFLLSKGGWQFGENSLESAGTHEALVLLSDIIYESINLSRIEALIRGGENDEQEWSYEEFYKCLNTALEFLDADGPLTVQVTAAFAFLRAILDVVASELERIFKDQELLICESLPVVYIFANKLRDSSSPSRLAALRLYLLKVLHLKRGLSLVEISSLATRCGEIEELKEYTTLLQWETMHDVVANPLGFDPFWASSALFEKSGEAIHYLSSGQASRGVTFIEHAANDPASQRQITAAVASRLYLPSSARALTPGERAACQWLLSRPKCLQQWNQKWTEVIQCFAQSDRGTSTWSSMKLSPNMSTQDLWFTSLAAHIFFVVTDLPATSPLQGYMALDKQHFERAYVVGAPDSFLAAFRTLVGTKDEKIAEYKCPCGYEYFVGNCGKPVQSTTCPSCTKPIGGANYVLAAGNVDLGSQRIQTGYIIDNVSRTETFYSVRSLEYKCYRALRLLVHFCLSIGAQRASTTDQTLQRLLGLAPQTPPHPQEELRNIIEEDLAKLDSLLDCNRDTSMKYMHSVVSFLSGMYNHVALVSADARVQWEAEFQSIFDNDTFGSGARKAAADYLERQKGDNRYAELVEERGRRMFASTVEDILRITASPSLANFETMYKQDSTMKAENPLIQVFFDHEKDLEDLKHFRNLVLFCNTAHEVFGSRISRHEAASMSMKDALTESSGLSRQYEHFEKAWNAIREKVKGYECRTFTIPIMSKEVKLATCLVEPRDLGLNIVALFEYLRNVQNAFLRDASPAVDARARGLAFQTVRVQACKNEDIVHLDKQWLEDVVKEVGMATPRSGCGLRVLYDSVIIQNNLFRALVAGKAHLDADWMEFAYKYEAFHRHATILADVATAIPQEVLRPETLQAIHREIELRGVGAGQFLELMNLCLGHLRRTGGYPLQTLSAYCKIWLGKDSAELISDTTVFEKICLKHIVSLYEGLEDSASTNVETLVRNKYKKPLTSALFEELLNSVKKETTWKKEADVEKIPVSTFVRVLKKFLFRYLTVDNHPDDVPLYLYLTDSRLVKWPADLVSEDVVDECFPPSLLTRHSLATYMLLCQLNKGGDWEKAGQRNGLITNHETQ